MSKKILVIESDAPFARELSSAIEARGLEARVTGDGKEGFDLAKVDRPDAIVLCVELPRMSGYSICNKLKKDDELKSIPLVIMSAEATPETFEQHRKLKTRAEDYLIKPFAPAELLQRIAQLVELPAAPDAPAAAAPEDEEVVTLDDVEELETTGERPAPAGEDDDLKLLDEAFESLAAESAPTPGVDEVASGDVLEIDAPVASDEIDRLGADADAALAALGLDEEEIAEVEAAPPLVEAAEPEPTYEPDPSQTGAEPIPVEPPPALAEAAFAAAPAALAAAPAAPSAEHAAEVQRLEDRVSELLIEISRVREALDERGTELDAARARAAELEAEVEAQRGGARDAQEQTRRDAEAALAETRAALAEAKERLEAAEERVRTAEEVTRSAEAKAAASEAESAELTLKLEEAEQVASLRATESEGARERAEALTRELTEARGRAEALEADLATARGEAGAARADVAAARAEGERAGAELKRRVTELEAQTAKHEERVVKAYQKIKGDEKIREKTRKALAIALQLLEERAPGAPAAEVQPRRE